MLQGRRDPDFPKEECSPERTGQLGAKNLHRDIATMLLVLGEENRRSAAAADLANDAVSAGENRLGCRELMERHASPGGQASTMVAPARRRQQGLLANL